MIHPTQSQGSGTKFEEVSENQNTSVAQTLGIKRSMEKLQEKEEQPFSNCQWNEKDEKGGIDQGEESQEDID